MDFLKNLFSGQTTSTLRAEALDLVSRLRGHQAAKAKAAEAHQAIAASFAQSAQEHASEGQEAKDLADKISAAITDPPHA